VANAAAEGRSIGGSAPPAPFHGYLFKILTAYDPDASWAPVAK